MAETVHNNWLVQRACHLLITAPLLLAYRMASVINHASSENNRVLTNDLTVAVYFYDTRGRLFSAALFYKTWAHAVLEYIF